MSFFKLTTTGVSIRRFSVVLAIAGLALGAKVPVHAAIIDGTFSGTITRITDGYNFYGHGPTPSDLVGTTVTGTFRYDTSSFLGAQCSDAATRPTHFCVNESILDASISTTVASQTVTVTQSSDVSAISNGNFAIGDNSIGVVPGFPVASGDYFSLNAFTPSSVGSLAYSPGPSVDFINFINGIDTTQTFSSDAPSFAPSHLRAGGAYVEYIITNIRTTVSDTTAPVLTVPAGFAVDATSPQGGTVNYTVTATDNSSVTSTVSCSPPSGATFAIGTTTVNCTATDGANNSVTGSFTVTVNGAEPQLLNLIDLVGTVSSPFGTTSSLDAKLQNAMKGSRSACNSLGAFINEARAQSGKKLPVEQASMLIESANQIRAVLGCP